MSEGAMEGEIRARAAEKIKAQLCRYKKADLVESLIQAMGRLEDVHHTCDRRVEIAERALNSCMTARQAEKDQSDALADMATAKIADLQAQVSQLPELRSQIERLGDCIKRQERTITNLQVLADALLPFVNFH